MPSFSRHGLARRDAHQDRVEEVYERDGGRGVEQVGVGILGVAEWAVGQHGGAVFVVEQTGSFTFEFLLDNGVSRCNVAAQLLEAREEQAGRGGGLGSCEGEDVLGGEGRGGGEGEEGGGDGEEHDGEEGPGGERDDGFLVGAGLSFGAAVPAYAFRQEHGPEEDEKGLDTVGIVTLAGYCVFKRTEMSELLTSPMISLPWLQVVTRRSE